MGRTMSRRDQPDACTTTRQPGQRPLDADECPPASSVGPTSPRSADALETLRAAEQRLRQYAGLRLENLHMLEIGTHQDQRHLRLLALHNDVVGIDAYDLGERFHLGDYLRSLGQSPAVRAVKSLRRKMLGARPDPARGAAAVARELGVTPFTPPRLARMSASDMSFPDATFSLVCSFAAFEHVEDRGAALREVVRVLRPGGVAYIRVRPYTGPSGYRGGSAFADEKPQPPYWPHLRAELAHTLRPDPRLNRLSVKEWLLLFTHIMRGVELVSEGHDAESREALAELRARGELAEHSDEDLLTARLVAIWKKRRGAASFGGRR